MAAPFFGDTGHAPGASFGHHPGAGQQLRLQPLLLGPPLRDLSGPARKGPRRYGDRLGQLSQSPGPRSDEASGAPLFATEEVLTPTTPHYSIIVPVLGEADSIHMVLNHLRSLEQQEEAEILVVDG